METLPWYQSRILQQQIAQFIIAALTMLGVTTDVDWDVTTQAIFGGIAAVLAVWTAVTRIFKANPPITEAAAIKEVEFQTK